MSHMEVAKTILEQLGGSRFRAMVGAKTVLATNPKGSLGGLEVHLPSNFAKDKINRVEVVLEESDTYTVFFRFVSVNHKTFEAKVKEIAKVSDVYVENLRQVFRNHTGLETSL